MKWICWTCDVTDFDEEAPPCAFCGEEMAAVEYDNCNSCGRQLVTADEDVVGLCGVCG